MPGYKKGDAMRSFVLVLLLMGAVCPASFAAPAECESAAASCTAQCGQLQIKDPAMNDRRHAILFQRKCEDSCSNGLHNCQLQDSKNGCDTFYYHCAEACPWTVAEQIDVSGQDDQDIFSECAKACEEGQKSCQAAGQTPRKRTGDFDACVEAQEACYADCSVTVPMDEDFTFLDNSDFPGKCAKACFTGVAPCQAVKGKRAQCQEYFKKCDMACPDSVTDQDGNTQSSDSIDMDCHDSCEKGEDYCENILK
jgi:hypothetical protein